MTIAASLCLDMECPQWYNKDDIVHLSARALREKAAVPVWRRGKHMTQGDERMKAAKTSIRQRLTHSKLPMLVLVGVVNAYPNREAEMLNQATFARGNDTFHYAWWLKLYDTAACEALLRAGTLYDIATVDFSSELKPV